METSSTKGRDDEQRADELARGHGESVVRMPATMRAMAVLRTSCELDASITSPTLSDTSAAFFASDVRKLSATRRRLLVLASSPAIASLRTSYR
jgi:hypothetical protein